MKTKIQMIIWVTTIIYLKKATLLKKTALQILIKTYKIIKLIFEIKMMYNVFDNYCPKRKMMWASKVNHRASCWNYQGSLKNLLEVKVILTWLGCFACEIQSLWTICFAVSCNSESVQSVSCLAVAIQPVK